METLLDSWNSPILFHAAIGRGNKAVSEIHKGCSIYVGQACFTGSLYHIFQAFLENKFKNNIFHKF